MLRREFLAASAALGAAESGGIEVALLTHADGPHLSAYLEGLALAPEVGTVFLADAGAEGPARKALGGKLGGVYGSAKELLRAKKPKLALVPMEARLAPPVVDAALEAGCHVMAEKPACVRAEEFAPLAAKADQRGQMLVLAFANRIDPLFAEARRLMAAGTFGKFYGMEMHLVADQTRLTRPAYHKTWTASKARAGGGHLIWLGIHWLDLAMYITGQGIGKVAGFTANVGGQPIDTEDAAAITFQFSGGALGTLTSGYYVDRGKQSHFQFWGEKGWMRIAQDSADRRLEWQVFGGPVQWANPAGPTGYTPWVRHVVRSAMGQEKPVLNAKESLRALRTVFAGYRAAEGGRTVTV